jgi:thymidylate synthase
MKYQYNFDSIDEVQIWLLEELFSEGELITTRELNTIELCNVNFCLTNPLNRNTTLSKRNWKHALAIGEFAWHVSGSNDLDFISYYARQWKNFSNDGKSVSESCYGHKIFKKDASGQSQWNRLIKLLNKDKYSRRAVLDFYNSGKGIDYFAIDIACVCTVQFLIRNEKLDVIVNMRSNDLIWGMPYDIYLFSMLQEMLAIELDVELGKYFHNVGSMHIYERHFNLGREVLDEGITTRKEQPKMDNLDSIETFIKYEELIRLKLVSLNEIEDLSISNYWKTLLFCLFEYKQKKQKIME